MSDDWKRWIGGVNPQARAGLIHMLGVCVDDCEVMAKAGREALDALNASTAYWSPELDYKVAAALGTMDNYMSFPLETLQGALYDWQVESGIKERKALAAAEARAVEALAEVARLRSAVEGITLPPPATLE